VLYADETRAQAVADAVHEAFGDPVIVNRVSGNMIHLHLGELAADCGPERVTNTAYRRAINQLPQVQNQGDGIKSFVGLTLLLTSAEYPLVLIDEPEAFLHPPQARLLGRTLARAAKRAGTQLLIATRSLDVLRGVLEADQAEVTVVRLRREGPINHASVLPPDKVRSLWDDPLIRFSNALDGVFHRGVVVCEADGDARLYDASLQSAKARQHESEHGLLFTHCGGKARVPTVIDALSALDVPVRAVCDIDVLREQGLLRRLIEALGGQWADVERDWRIVKSNVDGIRRQNPTLAEVRAGIAGVLDESEEVRLTEHLSRRIRDLIKADDGWTALKAAGFAATPPGDATAAIHRLDTQLRTLGLFVPPVGELEGWDREVGGHGPPWVVEAMRNGIHQQQGALADFVTSIAASVP